MKYFIAIAAFATLLTSPAIAQSYDPSIGSGNINAVPYQASQPPRAASPHDAHAQVPMPATPNPAGVQAPHLGGAHHGSPYGQYDADGRLLDQNAPGRW